MSRRSSVVWGLVAVIAGAFSIVVNTEVQDQRDRLDRINREIADHDEAVNVLRAEWSYVNRPARIEALARRHLDLGAPRPDQAMRISELPFAGRPDAPESVPARRPSAPLLMIEGPATIGRGAGRP